MSGPESQSRVFLIRHGETPDNIANLYAGSRDTPLTNHGMLQAQRLGDHLWKNGVRFTHMYSSDLCRAVKTAEAIRDAQVGGAAKLGATEELEVMQVSELREQDFGHLEGKSYVTVPWTTSPENGAAGDEPETTESLTKRINNFLDAFFFPLLAHGPPCVIAIVSHGLLLAGLWRAILARQQPRTISFNPEIAVDARPTYLTHLGRWSNTAYLELTFTPLSPKENKASIGSDTPPRACEIIIVTIDGKDHLEGLKRTGTGIGSAKYDESQRSITSFFTRRTGT